MVRAVSKAIMARREDSTVNLPQSSDIRNDSLLGRDQAPPGTAINLHRPSYAERISTQESAQHDHDPGVVSAVP